jgi:hypothetical protein
MDSHINTDINITLCRVYYDNVLMHSPNGIRLVDTGYYALQYLGYLQCGLGHRVSSKLSYSSRIQSPKKCKYNKWITFYQSIWHYGVQLLCWHIFYYAITRIVDYSSRAKIIALHNAMFTEKLYSFLIKKYTFCFHNVTKLHPIDRWKNINVSWT